VKSFLTNFHAHNDHKGKDTANRTVDVIDQIFDESRARSENYVQLYTTRNLLGKNQYMEFKADINEHMMN
jgi:hypothetical protein